MDVQIIAEVAMRLAEERFKSAYIVSEDKGFLPAVHYLQQTSKGKRLEIALVKNITQVVMRTVFSTMGKLKHAENVADVKSALAPLYGDGEACDLTKSLEVIFAKSQMSSGDMQGDEASVLHASSAGVGQCEGAQTEVEAGSASFIELPGIGRALAGKLEDAGIASPAELERIGAVEAWSRIYHSDASFPPNGSTRLRRLSKGFPFI